MVVLLGENGEQIIARIEDGTALDGTVIHVFDDRIEMFIQKNGKQRRKKFDYRDLIIVNDMINLIASNSQPSPKCLITEI